jgi:hypothetical protein
MICLRKLCPSGGAFASDFEEGGGDTLLLSDMVNPSAMGHPSARMGEVRHVKQGQRQILTHFESRRTKRGWFPNLIILRLSNA